MEGGGFWCPPIVYPAYILSPCCSFCGSNTSPAVWLENSFQMPFWRKATMWSLLFPLPGLLCFSLIPSGTALILAFEFAVALTRECLRSCAILKHTKHCTFECLVFSSIFNSELSFTASLYKGQVSNPRISWVKQPSGCCTSSLAILYQTFGILFSKFIFNFQNFYYQISGISWMSNRFRTPKMLSCCCSLLFHIHAQPTLIPRDLRGAGKVERADVAQLW